MTARVQFFVLLAVSALIAYTAIRVEWLCCQSGRSLPTGEVVIDGQRIHFTWRTDIVTTEERWRKICGPRDEDDQPTTRPLTDEECGEMQRHIREARANNSLRDLVESMGCLQYPLCATVIIWSLCLLRKRGLPYGRGWLAIPLSCGAAGLVLAFIRGYASSATTWL